MARQPKGKLSPPHWPSIEEQLAAAKVIRGSALERLIRENQDFSLLGPEEANDPLPLPPWLRVYWRKAHPEIDWGSEVAYPLILKEMCKWMLRHQDLPESKGPEHGRKDHSHHGEMGEGRN